MFIRYTAIHDGEPGFWVSTVGANDSLNLNETLASERNELYQGMLQDSFNEQRSEFAPKVDNPKSSQSLDRQKEIPKRKHEGVQAPRVGVQRWLLVRRRLVRVPAPLRPKTAHMHCQALRE